MARRDWSCALKHRVLGGCGSRDVAGRPTSRSVGVSGGAARRFSLTTEQLARVSQRLNPRRAIERHLRCRLRLRNRRKGSEWTSGRYRRRSIRAVCIAVRGRGRCWLRPRPGTGPPSPTVELPGRPHQPRRCRTTRRPAAPPGRPEPAAADPPAPPLPSNHPPGAPLAPVPGAPLAPLPINGRPVSATLCALTAASRSCCTLCAGLPAPPRRRLRAGVGPRTRAQRLHELGVNRRRLRTGHLIGPAVGGKQRRDRRRHLILGRGHDARRRSRRGRIGRAQHRAQSGQIRCRRPQHLRHRQHERHVPPPTRVSGPAPTTPPMTIDTDSDDKYTASSKTTTPFLPNTGGVCAAARGAAAHRVARPGARNRAAVSVTGHPPAPRGRCKPRSTKPAPPG